MNEIIIDTIVKIIIAVVVALVSTFLIPWIKALAENEKYAKLFKTAITFVYAAEQTIKGDGRGQERKQEVLKAVREWLNGKGLDITDGQIDALIESIVYQMNNPVNNNSFRELMQIMTGRSV